MKRWGRWLVENSLWAVGLGLMLASSGVDGAYMSTWMKWPFLGYVLNTVADISGMVLTYVFGRLQQDRSPRKRRWSYIVLMAEVVAVVYSWFFSWRQLRQVLIPVEGADAVWVAPIAAGFIPLLLAFIGYAESLMAGRFDDSRASRAGSRADGAGKTRTIEKPAPVRIGLPQFRAEIARMNGDFAPFVAKLRVPGANRADVVNSWLDSQGFARIPAGTARGWSAVVLDAAESRDSA